MSLADVTCYVCMAPCFTRSCNSAQKMIHFRLLQKFAKQLNVAVTLLTYSGGV
jgi:hypothetical protein